jgi:uncharacterized membrane protein YedE/YeeE
MMRLVGVFVSGIVFALGLGISGMTHPAKIIAFLDFSGAWDPSLALVMAGAVGTYALLYPRIRRRPLPLFGASFAVPTRTDVDARLIGGAALFGVGWGLGGFCPGPAIVALVSGVPAVFVFVASMLFGMAAFELQVSAYGPTIGRERVRASLSPGGSDE